MSRAVQQLHDIVALYRINARAEVDVSDLADMLREYRETRAAGAQLHDGLQRVGTALGLLAGADLTRDCVPAVLALQTGTYAAGLAKHVAKFVENNGLPPGSSESDFFILEAAAQRGFEMIDDDGDVYVCNSRQIVALVKPYKEAALAAKERP